MPEFVFAWTCPSPSRDLSDFESVVPPGALDDYNNIVDCIDRRSSDIDYETFAEKVGGERKILDALHYGSAAYDGDDGFKIKDDWSVSWHESTYPDGTPILYFVHSGIEHVFEPRDYRGPRRHNGRCRNTGLSFLDESSPLDYHGHRPQRLSLVDSSAPPPGPRDTYFTETTRKVTRSPTGRTLRTPKLEPVPGASPGVVAWVDYDAIPNFDSGARTGKGRLFIHYVTVRQDQRGKGLMRRLLDELLLRHADFGSVDFGDVHSATVWKYAQELRPVYEREGRLFRAKPMGMFRNPFEAKPKKFHGRQAGGTAQLPGFHTASARDKALPYAHQKGGAMDAVANIDEDCEECDDGRCPVCLSRWRINDYPVIVAIDMRGFRPEHDIDANQALENLMDAAGDALESDDPVGFLRGGDDCIESETPDSVEQALFQNMAVHEECPSGVFASFLEDLSEDEALAAIKTVAAGGRKAAKILMRVIGQFRYLKDVPSDRIVSVDYVTPIWDEILDMQGNETDEERASELEAAGWDVLDLDDVLSGSVHGNYKRVWERPTPPGARIEWHGTCYRNLLSAAPELAKELPIPPLPYEAKT